MSKQDVLEFLGAIPSYKAVSFEDIASSVGLNESYVARHLAYLKRKQMVSYFVISRKCFYRGMMA